MQAILVVVCTLGLCFGVDKLFTKMFRSQAEHKTGLSVRLSKRYGAFGLIMIALGVAAIFTGLGDGLLLVVGGTIVILVGIGLIVYFMTFGIFYDKDTFLLMTFGKKDQVYYYRDIRCQQLYMLQGGSTIIELQMTDGRIVQLQSAMEGTYAFMDHAFGAWLRQTGRRVEDCSFYDPKNSCWFPSAEAEG